MKKQKKTFKQIAAIIGILLLLSLYIMSFIFALTDNPHTMHFFGMSLVATVVIPVLIYVISMLIKLSDDRKRP